VPVEEQSSRGTRKLKITAKRRLKSSM